MSKYTVVLAAFLSVVLSAPSSLAAQCGQTSTPTKRQKIAPRQRVSKPVTGTSGGTAKSPDRRGRVRPPNDGGKSGGETGSKTDGGKQKPPRAGSPDQGSGEEHHHDDRPPSHRRPRVRTGISITIGVGSSDHDEKKKKSKDEETEDEDAEKDETNEEKSEKDEKGGKDKKADKEKNQDEQANVDEPHAPPASDDEIPRYDAKTYRRMIDAMFAANRIGAGLAMLELLKEREYFDYTGHLLMTWGETSSASEPGLFSRDDFVLAGDKKKSKKKKADESDEDSAKDSDDSEKKKKKKGSKKALEYGEGDWRKPFELYADKVLDLSAELARLDSNAALLATEEGQKRREKLAASLEKASTDLEALIDALASRFGKKNPTLKRLCSSEALMEQLAGVPGAVGVYTLSAETRVWMVVVTPTSRRVFSHPTPASELSAKVTALASVLRDRTANPIPPAAALYQVLLAPIDAELRAHGADTLLWSLDGPLRYVPVAALHDGSGYLVERYACSVLSRASISKLGESPSRPWRGVGLGVSAGIGKFAPLPAVADELRGIFATGGADAPVSGEVLLDDRFTETAFVSALKGAPPVVHVATHFQLKPGAPGDSVLLLGDGTLLSVEDIRQMPGVFKGIELLALSACETALPASDDGKEVECFATIAQNRGARSVVASLWPVNDRSTSALMQAFYRVREARPDLSKVHALRAAQQMLLSGAIKNDNAGGPDRALVHTASKGAGTFVKDPSAPFGHPYYWASFILLGNPR